MASSYLDAIGFIFLTFALFAFPVWLIGYFVVGLIQSRRQRVDQFGSAEFREPPASPTSSTETGRRAA